MSKISKTIIDRFSEWFLEAENNKVIAEANAVNLATVSEDGRPSNRMVLLKDYDEHGFVFYTNLTSRKGRQLAANANAAMCFYWENMGKQVRIEGAVISVSDDEADAYFASRPLKSRIGAWASKQSQPLDSQSSFLKDVAVQTARFATSDVPRPEFWSGFRLVPNRVEFWQKGEYRLHERLTYSLDNAGEWQEQLLYP